MDCQNNDAVIEIDKYCEEMLETYEEKMNEESGQIQALTTVQRQMGKQISKMKEKRELQGWKQHSALGMQGKK